MPANKRDMGMVFQSYSLFPTMSAQDNVAFGLRHARRSRRRAGARGRPSCSSWSGWPSTSRSTRTRCPAASSSAWRWPARWPSRRGCCCSTSRCPRWTPRCASSCATRSAASSSSSASPRSSSPTTRRRRCRWPTGSASCAPASSSSARAPAELYDRPATPFVAEFVGTMNRLAGDGVEATARSGSARRCSPADGELPAAGRQRHGARAARGGRRHRGSTAGDAVVERRRPSAARRPGCACCAHRRHRAARRRPVPPGRRAARPARRVSIALLDRPVLLASRLTVTTDALRCAARRSRRLPATARCRRAGARRHVVRTDLAPQRRRRPRASRC